MLKKNPSFPGIEGPILTVIMDGVGLNDSPVGNAVLHANTPTGTTHVMLLRASCPAPFGPAFGCPNSLPAILSSPRTLWRGLLRWCQNPART